MIQVNLLPPEHRAAQGTPVARFAAIVAGVVVFIGVSCVFAYTHFIQLAKVREVQALREEEVKSKEAQRDRSRALQAEVDDKAQRRRAIQTINRNRVLWSRKLDQFFDIVAGRDLPYNAWLEEVEVPTHLAMTSPNEGPAQSSAFHKAITGDPDVTKKASEFYSDFLSISNPTIDILANRDDVSASLTPPVVGAFKYDLRLKSPALDGTKPAKKTN
jgi:cell division protein FtsB